MGKNQSLGEGGYYSRIFLNVRGREPNGVIDPADYEKERNDLIAKLEALGDEQGNPIGTKVYKPQELYKEVNGVAPDLITIFGDLNWRSVGTVGHGSVHTRENDTGPDDANHAQQGVYIYNYSKMPNEAVSQPAHLYDIGRTVLKFFGLTPPDNWNGKPLTFV